MSEITEIIDRCPSGALKYELKSQIRIEFERNHNSSRAYDGDKLIGDCHFAELKGIWTISRTDVELGYEGRGIGKKLIQNVVDHARQENVKIVPMCPYAKKVMLNNPEYADIIY